MTTSPTTDADRFTPKLVDLNFHGGNLTITFLLNGKYFTAERIYPDFTDMADDAKLDLVEPPNGPIAAQMHARRQQIGRQTREARCEQHLIETLLRDRRAIFGTEFQVYLRDNRLEDVEPTNSRTTRPRRPSWRCGTDWPLSSPGSDPTTPRKGGYHLKR